MNRKTWYRTVYLQSEHWTNLRQKIKQERNNTCQVCGTKSNYLDCHHLSYDRLGKEEPRDILLVCRDCHDEFHRPQTVASLLEYIRNWNPL